VCDATCAESPKGQETVGIYECPECGYLFDEETGDPNEGYPAGTLFASLPEEFSCPDCSVRFKQDFEEQ
jgi:rubredoxin